MKYRMKTLTTLLLFVVILLAGCIGCGLKIGTTPNGQETPAQKNATGDADTLKVKIGYQPSERNLLLKPSESNRAPSDELDSTEAGNNDRNWAYPTISREFSDHLDKVNHDGNNYFSNPNYWQEKYDLIDEYLGLDTESTVRFIIEHNLYTEAIVKYLDDYDAFRYVEENAPDKGIAVELAERVFANEPGSLKGLETGLYLARTKEDIGGNIAEGHTAYLAVLRHHPESIDALWGLGNLLYSSDAPENAIHWFQKANRHVPAHFNYNLTSCAK
jgi:hypothetical protein